MATIYPTTFSDISNLPKKDIKVIESQFPFVPPEDVKFEPCGQIVSKSDIGSNVKFCPICDFPMIVRIMNYPCEHVMCYECSQPEKGYCYICEEKIQKSIRKNDMAKLYECDYPDCFKFFESYDKLKIHKSTFHGVVYDGNLNLNINNIGMNYNALNMMNRGIIPGQFVNPIMGMGLNQYMIPTSTGLPNQQNQTNNTSSINPMNNLNNNMIPSNLNNIINNNQNLNNITGNAVP
jgi:hypothetical protein